MNIESLSTERMNRGIVVSLFEPERPIIETYTDGNKVMPVAFLRGLPMPYNVFVLYLAMRFAPKRSLGQMPKMHKDGVFSLYCEDQLKRLWLRLDIPKEFKESLNEYGQHPKSVSCILDDTMFCMFSDHLKKEDPTGSFKDLIHRIDDDYKSSLVDPVAI